MEAVEAIEAENGDVGWTHDHFAKELASDISRFFVVEEADKVIGYGGYWKVGPEAQITNLVIRRDRQCRGLGRRLLEFLMDCASGEACSTCTLEVRASNAHAQKLYKTIGFTEVGRRKNIYKNPDDDAVLMEKTL